MESTVDCRIFYKFFPILSYVNYDKISIHYAFLLNILLYCSYPPLLLFWIESTQLHATKYVLYKKQSQFANTVDK